EPCRAGAQNWRRKPPHRERQRAGSLHSRPRMLGRIGVPHVLFCAPCVEIARAKFAGLHSRTSLRFAALAPACRATNVDGPTVERMLAERHYGLAVRRSCHRRRQPWHTSHMSLIARSERSWSTPFAMSVSIVGGRSTPSTSGQIMYIWL